MLPPTVALAFLGTAVFVLGGPLAAGYWTHRDATVRGSERAGLWGAGAALLLVPVLPLYLYLRRRLGPRLEWGEHDRLSGTVATALLAGWLVTTVIAPPDPYTQVRWAVPVAVGTGVLAHLVAVRRVPVTQ